MGIRQLTPTEARDFLDAKDDAVFLDVRSKPEFDSGHVPGSVNIPLLHLDTATMQMTPNTEFMKQVHESFAPEKSLVVGCLSGMRSQRACEMLHESGYTGLANMRGGLDGARDGGGRILEPGWLQERLPICTEKTEGNTCAAGGSRPAPGGA